MMLFRPPVLSEQKAGYGLWRNLRLPIPPRVASKSARLLLKAGKTVYCAVLLRAIRLRAGLDFPGGEEVDKGYPRRLQFLERPEPCEECSRSAPSEVALRRREPGNRGAIRDGDFRRDQSSSSVLCGIHCVTHSMRRTGLAVKSDREAWIEIDK